MDVRDEAKPIPDDIMAKARAHARNIWIDRHNEGMLDRAVGEIASAILAERESATLAEREACAAMSRAWTVPGSAYGDRLLGHREARWWIAVGIERLTNDQIAAAIEKLDGPYP